MDIHEESDLPRENPFHDGTNSLFYNDFLCLMNLEYEFIMHLQEHTGFITTIFYETINLYHREFDDICSRTLNRHIDSLSLRSRADHLIAISYSRYVTSASIECLYIAVLLGSIEYGVIVRTYSWIHGIEGINILGCLGRRSVNNLGETKSSYTIDNSEID